MRRLRRNSESESALGQRRGGPGFVRYRARYPSALFVQSVAARTNVPAVLQEPTTHGRIGADD